LEVLKKKWWPVTQNYDKTQFPDNFFNTVQPFAVPDVKLYCRICKRKEPYNPILATDFIYHGIKYSLSEIPNTAQVFFISYSCQSCKSFPEVIQIRRDNLKLTIAGRAPMEFIEVPKEIPKQINSFYSSAVIAFQSGQSLAANFLFRTLIEQWCYFSVSEKLESADQALESYMNELPDDFKDRFYSLRELYKSLSEDIHKAKGDEKLFKEVKEKIDEHFQARLLFKI